MNAASSLDLFIIPNGTSEVVAVVLCHLGGEENILSVCVNDDRLTSGGKFIFSESKMIQSVSKTLLGRTAATS